VGKRNLEEAIRQLPQYEVTVKWLPFLLRPAMPPDGAMKPPVDDPRQRVGARMKQAGEAVGIDFTGKCDRYPNSVEAHALLKFAADTAPEKQNALQEELFRQYFTDGLYPAGENLAKAADAAGLDGPTALAFAQKEANKAAVTSEAQANSRSGISGVPFFFIDGEPLGSGAQPPSTFVSALHSAAE